MELRTPTANKLGNLISIKALIAGTAILVAFNSAEMHPDQQSDARPLSTAEQADRPIAPSKKTEIIAPLPNPPSGLLQQFLTQAVENAAQGQGDPALASVVGVVLLPDGQPFEGARVILEDLGYDSRGVSSHRNLPTLKADDAGRFEQLNLPPSEYRLKVTEPEAENTGNAYSELARVTLEPGEKRDLQLVFGTEGDLSVSGVVIDTHGQPIAGARAQIIGTVPRHTRSDAQGRFTLRYLPDQEVQVNTQLEGYSQASVFTQAGDQDVQLIMLAHGALEGRVIDSRTRLAIPSFEAGFVNDHRPILEESHFVSKEKFQNENGSFEFPSVFGGNVTVMARAPGYAPASKLVVVEERETLRDVVIELNKSSSITIAGKVVDGNGRPIPKAMVYLGDMPIPVLLLEEAAATTDAAGEFVIENAPAETPYLSAFRAGYLPASAAVSESVSLVLRIPGRLEVSVFSDGKPAYKIPVRLGYFDDQRREHIDGGMTDVDGRALLSEVVPGDVLVRVVAGPHREQCALVHIESGKLATLRIDLAPAIATVEGDVLENQAPVSEGVVTLFVETAGGLERLDGRISPEGTFSIEDVPPGVGELVVAAAPRFQRTLVRDLLITAGTVSVPVDVAARGSVRGTLHGVRPGDTGTIIVLRGSMNAEDGVKAYRRTYVGTEVADYGTPDHLGDFEAGVDEPGTYTLMALTYPENDRANVTCHEIRVVEVTEGQEVESDFTLRY